MHERFIQGVKRHMQIVSVSTMKEGEDLLSHQHKKNKTQRPGCVFKH